MALPSIKKSSKEQINKNEIGYPFFIKAPLVIIGLFLFFYMLKLLQDILMPFVFAGLIAVLLNPVYNYLFRWKMNKIIAILLTILLGLIVVGGILFFLSSQIVQFDEMIPQLNAKVLNLLHQMQQWLSAKFGISSEKQMSILNEAMKNSKTYVGQTINTVFGIVSYFVLIPLYVFLLLFYKTLLLEFLYEVFEDDHAGRVAEILHETKSAIQSYIVGLLIETCIIAGLNSIALLVLGVKYAILLGVIGALLNLVPYIGGLIAIALPVLMSFVYKDGLTTPVLIIVAYSVIQFLDNNIIVPKIVSSKVSVNALMSILVVLLGGALWGVSGMFLSIPFVAVLKIIFDRVDGLKPWGKLLGDKLPKRVSTKIVNKGKTTDE
ncbi:AI-2E family transporter [Arachidicoccus ginsenosidimutans]|uniref:AI-2E family transporter n=1 Tax=Arachidicoccus sp. BS20 TaxID=1850526 RepID=UPI0007F05317|nr:AI-2E family transporter [Arachidicoccus sp. BS20]ANI90566.1 AI-2E family transporter [Arachidicoccus sp. BS20]